MKFRPGGFFDLLFNIELKKVGVKIFREISYFSSPSTKLKVKVDRYSIESQKNHEFESHRFYLYEKPRHYLLSDKLKRKKRGTEIRNFPKNLDPHFF